MPAGAAAVRNTRSAIFPRTRKRSQKTARRAAAGPEAPERAEFQLEDTAWGRTGDHGRPGEKREEDRQGVNNYMTKSKEVQMYTDGACKRNPGPGGYGVVLRYSEQEKVLSQGFRLTTNNRMEMLAAIAGLEALSTACAVTITSDSKYLVDGVVKGWAQKWRGNNWKKSDGQKALNPDLWTRLLDLCDRHQVTFVWVRGHAGHPENERCDEMATSAAAGEDLFVDEVYEMTSV